MAIGMIDNGPRISVERLHEEAEKAGLETGNLQPRESFAKPEDYELARLEWQQNALSGRHNLNGDLDKYPLLREVQTEGQEIAQQKEGWLTKVRNTPVIKQACDVAGWGFRQVTEHPIRTGLIVLAGVLAYNYFSAVWAAQAGAAMEGTGMGSAGANQSMFGAAATENFAGEMGSMPAATADSMGSASATGGLPDYAPPVDAATGPVNPADIEGALDNFGN